MRAGEGLPYLHNWDEPLVASRALHMMQTGDFNPHFFNYGTLTIYMTLAVDVLHYYQLAGLPPGDPSSLNGLRDIQVGDDHGWKWDLAHPSGTWLWDVSHPSFYLWDRRLFAILGTASVLLCFILARRVSGDGAGLLAAAALAGIEYDVSYAAIVTPNLLVSFLVLLAVVLAVLFFEKEDPLLLVGSLAACGLATAAKYNAALSIVAPLLALSLSAFERRAGHRRWLWTAVVLVPAASFLLAMPYALLDFPKFLGDSAFELRHYSTGHGTATVVPGLTHLGMQVGEIVGNLGLPVALIAAVGVAGWTRRRSTWIVVAFPVAYLLFMSRMRVFLPRNLLAIYPFAALAFGCGAASIAGLLASERPERRAWMRAARIAVVLLVAGLCGAGIASALTRSWRIASAKESRSEAVDRVNAIVAGSPAGKMRVGIEEALRIHDEDLRRLKVPYDVLPLRELVCGDPEEHDLIVIAANRSGYGDEAREAAAAENARLPVDRVELARVGDAEAIYLDIYSVSPAIRILGGASRSGALPVRCGGKIPFGAMVLSRDYPVLEDGTLAIYWNGTVATPPFMVSPGDYEFRWRARGTPVAGEFPSVRAEVLDARGSRAGPIAAPRTFALTSRLEPCALRFHMEREGEVLLRIDFDDDAYDASRREDSNVFLEPINLVPVDREPEGLAPVSRDEKAAAPR
jgi:4-amino-4-deoxy-L-arabinose transferase-like glycosyltransferase